MSLPAESDCDPRRSAELEGAAGGAGARAPRRRPARRRRDRVELEPRPRGSVPTPPDVRRTHQNFPRGEWSGLDVAVDEARVIAEDVIYRAVHDLELRIPYASLSKDADDRRDAIAEEIRCAIRFFEDEDGNFPWMSRGAGVDPEAALQALSGRIEDAKSRLEVYAESLRRRKLGP